MSWLWQIIVSPWVEAACDRAIQVVRGLEVEVLEEIAETESVDLDVKTLFRKLIMEWTDELVVRINQLRSV